MQKLLFIASTRIPTERAMGVAVMKQCEAFSRAGLTVELVVPKRYNEHTEDPYVYHDVERVFLIRYLWSLDLVSLDEHPFRFLLQKATFFISLCVYVARSNAEKFTSSFGRRICMACLIKFRWSPSERLESSSASNAIASSSTLVTTSCQASSRVSIKRE